MQNLADSIARARREYDAALARGDTDAAEMIERALAVLEQAGEGLLIPEQRKPED